MTIGQWAELRLMFTVPFVVAKLGIKKTMILGAAAWALRFGLSAIGQPYWLMISTIALHGFAFGYFFVPGQMFVDQAASEDIKATAQNFLLFVVYGMGTILGSVVSGQIRTAFSDVDLQPGDAEDPGREHPLVLHLDRPDGPDHPLHPGLRRPLPRDQDHQARRPDHRAGTGLSGWGGIASGTQTKESILGCDWLCLCLPADGTTSSGIS